MAPAATIGSDPSSPWSWLPPTAAGQYELARYLAVATLAAFGWDWLVSLGQEFKMLVRDGLTMPIIVYFISRLMTSTSIVCTVILLTIPIQDCQGLISAIAWLTVALAASTSFLFLLRVLAIFHGQRVVVGLFVLLWLAIVGSAVIVPLNIHGAHIGSTGYCAPIGAGVSVGVFGVITMIDRLLVFLFISWRLTAYHDSRVQAFFRGQGVSIVPRVLLSSGQLYYFATVGVNIANTALLFSSNIPNAYRVLLIGPSTALENAMACRVFRQLKFDTERTYIDSVVDELEIPSIRSRPRHNGALRFARHGTLRSTTVGLESVSSELGDAEDQHQKTTTREGAHEADKHPHPA